MMMMMMIVGRSAVLHRVVTSVFCIRHFESIINECILVHVVLNIESIQRKKKKGGQLVSSQHTSSLLLLLLPSFHQSDAETGCIGPLD